MSELAYLNGVFSPIDEAKVSIEDRGFQFGDSIYEVIVSYEGKLFQPKEHLQRMKRSAEAIKLKYDFENQPLEPIIEEGIRRSELNDAMVYIQITRGVAPRNHTIPSKSVPTVVMTFKPRLVTPEDVRQRGIKMVTVTDTRWAKCYIKAVILLPNVLAKYEAAQRGCDDAIFVTADGEVRECTSANIFIAKNNQLIFPQRDESILHGITQNFLLNCAQSINVETKEQRITVEELFDADEVFMSNTTVEVLGITTIDGKPINAGNVGPLTKRIYEAFVTLSRSGQI